MSDAKFYGWRLAAVLFLINLSGSIALLGGNIANTFMVKQTGMSRSLFGAGFSLLFLLVGIASPLVAKMGDKKGERFTISFGMAWLWMGTILMPLVGDLPAGYIGVYGLVIGTGFAFSNFLPAQTLITHWFERKRAMVTGLVSSAAGFAGIVSAPLVNRIIQFSGGNWRQPWIFIAFLVGLTTIIGILFIRNTPTEMGQIPDGDRTKEQPSDRKQKRTKKEVYQTRETWTLKEALYTTAFWIILLAASAEFMGYYLCLGHGIIHLMDLGVPTASASLSLGILSFSSIIGRLISGILGDRIEPRFVITGGLLLTMLGCLILIHATSPFSIYLYAVLVGQGFGLVNVCLFTLLGNYFGSEKIRDFLGISALVFTLLGAAAPLAGGISKDYMGSYSAALIGAAGIAAIGAISLIFAFPPVKSSKSN
ncbi:MAG: MFS transporter [Candidatus Omnitrophota bacterium]